MRDRAIELDKNDPISGFRDRFHIPKHNGQDSVYLCGNSLGLQPKTVSEYVHKELEDWAKLGVEGHFEARHPWMPYHEFLTKQMANIVGAKPTEVVVMNSLTVNLHLLMVSFYRPTKVRYKIVVERDAFPSDRYAIESQLKFHGVDPKEGTIIWGEYSPPLPNGNPSLSTEGKLRYEDLERIFEVHGDEIALIMVGGVNYYTGQAFDLKRITNLAHKHGAIAGFDQAHAAGNIDLQLHDSGADFAAWCSYKYLNSGPGGLSGVFIHERHADNKDLPRFAGWWGHNKETRFDMRDDFEPISGAEGWQLSNPPILPMAALRASLDIFEEVGMKALRNKSILMTNYLLSLLDQIPAEKITIITPHAEITNRQSDNAAERGCQLSILIHGSDKSLFDAITTKGVIADWRKPDVIRIAPVPLYNSFIDLYNFYNILNDCLK